MKNTSSPTSAPSIYIIDCGMAVMGLKKVIDRIPDARCVGSSSSLEEGYDAIGKLQKTPTHIITDLSVGTHHVKFKHISRLKSMFPQTTVIIFTAEENRDHAIIAVKSGASSVLSKRDNEQAIFDGLRRAFAGETVVTKEVSTFVISCAINGRRRSQGILKPQGIFEKVTPREMEVLLAMGDGRSVRQVAEDFHISVKTVETHRAHLKEKLNLQSGVELVRFAVSARNATVGI